MGFSPWIILLALGLADGAALSGESAADRVTLRDGTLILGQVAETSSRGSIRLLVRRGWAEANAPEWLKKWKAAESADNQRVESQRLQRLRAWQKVRARQAGAAGSDPIRSWIDAEVDRLEGKGNGTEPPLIQVTLRKDELQEMVRRPATTSRKLRLGWLCEFPQVETMPVAQLEQSLEGRGFSLKPSAPVSVDSLLPPALESETVWQTRRAVTEVVNDPGLKLVRYGSLLLPEPERGQPLEIGAAVSALSDLKQLLEGPAPDPLPGALSKIAAQGKIGAMVTQLDLSPDLTSVRVNSTLWVCRSGRWRPAGQREAVAQTRDQPANAGQPLAEDPQVKAVFKLVETLGLGNVPDEDKARSLSMGAATQAALAKVRAQVLEDFDKLALPVHDFKAANANP